VRLHCSARGRAGRAKYIDLLPACEGIAYIEGRARMRRTRHGAYAAGDVTGRDQFGYMAAHGARVAAENALNGNSRRYDVTAMPSIVFTDPQAASVGLTEMQAREQGLAAG